MNIDGSDVKRLTDDSFDDKEPEGSPDGSKIAFSSMRHLNIGEIYVMNADGTQQTRRTQSSGGLLSGAMSPAWSPDGTKIVYAARSGFLDGPEGLLPRLYTTVASAGLRCDPQGSVLRKSPQAIKNHEQLTAYTNPAWSPDGTKIAFSHLVSYLVVGVQQIKIMNVDGSGLVALTAQLGAEDDAAWSPDGSKFAFAGRVTGDTWEIYVVNADGSGEVRLTKNSVDDLSPTWSPDGSEIAFQSDRDGRPEIYVMKAEGSGLARLTNEGSWFAEPAWSQNGSRIVVRWQDPDFRLRDYDLFFIDVDGGDAVRLTDDPGDPRFASCSPDGSMITFSSALDV